ncbi:hypothetical protein EMCRGX_G013191 [Ephydatia muelleri]
MSDESSRLLLEPETPAVYLLQLSLIPTMMGSYHHLLQYSGTDDGVIPPPAPYSDTDDGVIPPPPPYSGTDDGVIPPPPPLVSYPDPVSHSCGWITSPLRGKSGDVIHPQLWESGSGYETTPPYSGIDDGVIPPPPPYSGTDDGVMPSPPPYSGTDDGVIPPPPPYSGIDDGVIPSNARARNITAQATLRLKAQENTASRLEFNTIEDKTNSCSTHPGEDNCNGWRKRWYGEEGEKEDEGMGKRMGREGVKEKEKINNTMCEDIEQ